MKIALFGKNFSCDFKEDIRRMFGIFRMHKTELLIYKEFADFLMTQEGILEGEHEVFTDRVFQKGEMDFLFSIGGDGTFLKTLELVRDSGIPVIGINTGRLGFLANISRDEISKSLDELFAGNYTIEERSLIRLTMKKGYLEGFNIALNEITVHKKEMGMISIIAELDGEYLNTYWADGLIISTPTGSTAYSMSVGGPIILPEAGNFIISPISPHNLTVRPIVVPENKKIHLSVKSRSGQFLIALDSRSFPVNSDNELLIDLAPYKLKLLKFKNNSFYNTLRNKLMWGMDKRN